MLDIDLKNTGGETSAKIGEEYPADWDMGAVFEKSWRKSMSGENVGDTLEFSEAEVISRRSRLSMFTIQHLTGAACILLVAALFGSLLLAPDRNNAPDNIELLPVITTSAKSTTVTTTTATSAKTSAAAETAVTDVTTDGTTAETSVTTTTAAAVQTTTAAETTAAPVTAAPETTAPREPSYYGHFEITRDAIPADEDFEQRDGLKYVRNEAVPIVPREHTRDFGEGFSVEEADDWWKDDVWKDGYFVGTDDDTVAMVVFVDYDTAKTDAAYNRAFYNKCEETAVNGRPALLFTSDKRDDILLIFDEGCHLCAVLVKKPSEMLNIGTIIEFAERI